MVKLNLLFRHQDLFDLRGKVNDPQIQSVLTYAMLNEQNPGSRLNSINAMDTEPTNEI